jgi:hypothetical protein
MSQTFCTGQFLRLGVKFDEVFLFGQFKVPVLNDNKKYGRILVKVSVAKSRRFKHKDFSSPSVRLSNNDTDLVPKSGRCSTLLQIQIKI